MLGYTEYLFWYTANNLLLSMLNILLFLGAFSLLEAFLPSFVSKVAPPSHRGAALGIYSCLQFLGIFVGGTMGGWLYGQFDLHKIYLFCGILTIIWLAIAIKMKIPHH